MGSGGGGVGGRGVGLGGQGGCDRRIEAFVKIQNYFFFFWGGGGGGGVGLVVRVDVIEELKFLGKFTKKNGGGGSRGGGVRSVWWGGGVSVDVNEELKFL